MKRAKFLIVCLGAALLIFGMTACAGTGAVSYENADRYSVGNASFTEAIESLDIDWVCGKVNLVTHADGGVLLSEKAASSLADDMRVHWWLDGTTLRVRFCAPGLRAPLLGYAEKELTIALPEGARLSSISVSTASANVAADKISASRLSVSTASGNTRAVCEADEIILRSASGNITLNQAGKTTLAQLHSVSGKIESRFDQCEKAEFDAVSGRINVTASRISSLSAKAVSGNISFALNKAADSCSLQTTSGAVLLALPDAFGFTLRGNSISGDFSSDLALKKSGNVYTHGDGAAEIYIKTVSGDISVNSSPNPAGMPHQEVDHP